jgi:hypothetical protein
MKSIVQGISITENLGTSLVIVINKKIIKIEVESQKVG